MIGILVSWNYGVQHLVIDVAGAEYWASVFRQGKEAIYGGLEHECATEVRQLWKAE